MTYGLQTLPFSDEDLVHSIGVEYESHYICLQSVGV